MQHPSKFLSEQWILQKTYKDQDDNNGKNHRFQWSFDQLLLENKENLWIGKTSVFHNASLFLSLHAERICFSHRRALLGGSTDYSIIASIILGVSNHSMGFGCFSGWFGIRTTKCCHDWWKEVMWDGSEKPHRQVESIPNSMQHSATHWQHQHLRCWCWLFWVLYMIKSDIVGLAP